MSHDSKVRAVARSIFRNKVVALKREIEDYKLDKKMQWDLTNKWKTNENSDRKWLREMIGNIIP